MRDFQIRKRVDDEQFFPDGGSKELLRNPTPPTYGIFAELPVNQIPPPFVGVALGDGSYWPIGTEELD